MIVIGMNLGYKWILVIPSELENGINRMLFPQPLEKIFSKKEYDNHRAWGSGFVHRLGYAYD